MIVEQTRISITQKRKDMKKIFVVAFMAMGLNSAFANTNIIVNDTIVNDSTKSFALPDTVATDTTKTTGYVENDTIITDSTKTAGFAENDTVITDSTKTEEVVTCDKAGEKAIRALAAQMR